MMIKKELSKKHTIIEEEVKEVDIEEEEIIIVSQENIRNIENQRNQENQESQDPNMMEKNLKDKTEVDTENKNNMMVKDLQDKTEVDTEVDTENKNNMMAKDLQDKTEEVIEEMAKEEMDREV